MLSKGQTEAMETCMELAMLAPGEEEQIPDRTERQGPQDLLMVWMRGVPEQQEARMILSKW